MSSGIEQVLVAQESPGEQGRLVRDDVGAVIGLLSAATATLSWVAVATLWPQMLLMKVLASALVLAALAGLALVWGRRCGRRTTTGGWWVAVAMLHGLGAGLAMATGLVLLIEMQARGVCACNNDIVHAIAHLFHP